MGAVFIPCPGCNRPLEFENCQTKGGRINKRANCPLCKVVIFINDPDSMANVIERQKDYSERVLKGEIERWPRPASCSPRDGGA